MGIVTQVTVDMGKPFFNSKDIPMNVTMDKVIDVDLDVNDETVTVSSVLLGVPHTEVFVDDITKAPVTTQGPILEKHDAFPSNTNVNYIEVETTIILRSALGNAVLAPRLHAVQVLAHRRSCPTKKALQVARSM